jgi:hypothetical protein
MPMVKALKKEVQGLAKGLKLLAGKVEKLQKRVDAVGAKKAKPAKRQAVTKAPKKKAAPKKKTAPKKKAAPKTPSKGVASAPAAILNLLQRRSAGVSVAEIRQKTGFGGQKVRSNVYLLKKRGLIKNKEKGVYVKA